MRRKRGRHQSLSRSPSLNPYPNTCREEEEKFKKIVENEDDGFDAYTDNLQNLLADDEELP